MCTLRASCTPHAARILTADLARHQGNRGSAVAQRNPNIHFDLRHPSRQRHGFDNARCSQNREAADDPQTRVESFTRNRFTTDTADEHIKAWISMARSLAWPRWRCCASLPYQCTGSKGAPCQRGHARLLQHFIDGLADHLARHGVDRGFADCNAQARFCDCAYSLSSKKTQGAAGIDRYTGEQRRAVRVVRIVATVLDHLSVCGTGRGPMNRLYRDSQKVIRIRQADCNRRFAQAAQQETKRGFNRCGGARPGRITPPSSVRRKGCEIVASARVHHASPSARLTVTWSDTAIELSALIINALMTVAAHGEPPRVPRLVIRGTCIVLRNASLHSAAPTKPTGKPTINCGRQPCCSTRRTASVTAVGASPMAIIASLPNSSQARRIPAAERVKPCVRARMAVAGSWTLHHTSMPSCASSACFRAACTIVTSVITRWQRSSARRPMSAAPAEIKMSSTMLKSPLVCTSRFNIRASFTEKRDQSRPASIIRMLSASMG